MLKGKCESKLQPNCIYGSLPPPSSLSLPFSAICRPTHTHASKSFQTFFHTIRRTAQMKQHFLSRKCDLRAFECKLRASSPSPSLFLSLLLFLSLSPSSCLFYLSLAYPLTAKTALTSEKVGAGQLIRNSSQSACSADGAYEQRSMALKLKVLRCNYPSSSRYISYIYTYVYHICM